MAAIKGLSVGNYAATIDGTNITLELPKSLRVSNGKVILSNTTSTVTVVGQSGAGSSTELTLDLTKDSYTLRATAASYEAPATKPQVVDYTLTIKTAAAQPASMSNMTLEDTKGNQYEATIDQAKAPSPLRFLIPLRSAPV